MIIVLVGYNWGSCLVNAIQHGNFLAVVVIHTEVKAVTLRLFQSRVTSLVQCFLFLGNILATPLSGRLVYCMTQNPS